MSSHYNIMPINRGIICSSLFSYKHHKATANSIFYDKVLKIFTVVLEMKPELFVT